MDNNGRVSLLSVISAKSARSAKTSAWKKRLKKQIPAEVAYVLGQGQAEYNSKHFEQNPTQAIIKND